MNSEGNPVNAAFNSHLNYNAMVPAGLTILKPNSGLTGVLSDEPSAPKLEFDCYNNYCACCAFQTVHVAIANHIPTVYQNPQSIFHCYGAAWMNKG